MARITSKNINNVLLDVWVNFAHKRGERLEPMGMNCLEKIYKHLLDMDIIGTDGQPIDDNLQDSDEKECCANCRFSKKHNYMLDPEEYYECRRYPPASRQGTSHYMVAADDWCGEYE